jgi:hypothetical protein
MPGRIQLVGLRRNAMRGCRLLLVATCCWAAGLAAHAGTVTVDFEAPTYDTGPILNGEGGWQVANPIGDQEVITGSNVISGRQSWRLGSGGTSGTFDDQLLSPPTAEEAGEGQANNYFRASLNFRPLAGGVQDEGLRLGMANGNGQRGNSIYFNYDQALGWGIAAEDYNLDTDDFSITYFGPPSLEAGRVYSLGFDVLFNPGPSNDVWRVFLDGSLVYTGNGWEDDFRDQGGPTTTVLYDRLYFQAETQKAGSAGVVFDDLSYETRVVPEPSSLALGGIAAALCLGGLWRQRRRPTAA